MTINAMSLLYMTYVDFFDMMQRLHTSVRNAPHSMRDPQSYYDNSKLTAFDFIEAFEKAMVAMYAYLTVCSNQTVNERNHKEVIAVACKVELIDDEQTWQDIRKTRNTISHRWNESLSPSILNDINSRFMQAFDSLQVMLEQKIQIERSKGDENG